MILPCSWIAIIQNSIQQADSHQSIDVKEIKPLCQGSTPLDITTLKDFFRFHVGLAKALIADTTTADSVNTTAEWFFAGFQRVTGNEYSSEDRSAIYHVPSHRGI